MSMKRRCNDADTTKCFVINLSQCQFFHRKSETDWPGIEPGSAVREAGDKPPEPWHGVRWEFSRSAVNEEDQSRTVSCRSSCLGALRRKVAVISWRSSCLGALRRKVAVISHGRDISLNLLKLSKCQLNWSCSRVDLYFCYIVWVWNLVSHTEGRT